MRRCKECGAYCDEGEVIGGICIDCLEESRIEQIRQSEIARIMNSTPYQLELELEV